MEQVQLEVIHREGKGWAYLIDPSHCPDYLLLKLDGYIEPAITDQYRQETIETYRQLIETGLGKTPVIADYRTVDMSNWTVIRAGKVNMGVFPAHHRVVVLPSEDESSPWLIDGINQFSTMMFRNFDLASSMEEALSKVQTH